LIFSFITTALGRQRSIRATREVRPAHILRAWIGRRPYSRKGMAHRLRMC
jgi:hypothetical protein